MLEKNNSLHLYLKWKEKIVVILMSTIFLIQYLREVTDVFTYFFYEKVVIQSV